MELSLDEALVWIVLWAVLLGATGGLAFGIAYPLESRSAGSASGTAVSLPHRRKDGAIDLGIAAPMALGAIASLAAVFAVAVESSQSGSVVSVGSLVWVGVAAGFGGTAFLEGLKTRLTSIVEARIEAALERVKEDLTSRIAEKIESRLPEWMRRATRLVEDAGSFDVAGEIADVVHAALEEQEEIRARRRPHPRGGTATLVLGVIVLVAGTAAGVLARGEEGEPRPARPVRGAEGRGGGAAPSRSRPPEQRTPTTAQPSSPTAGLPDLVVELGYDWVRVTNAGTAESGGFVAEVGQEGGEPSQYEFGPLAPGATRQETALLCATGTWVAVVDPGDVVQELDEDNNLDTQEGYVC